MTGTTPAGTPVWAAALHAAACQALRSDGGSAGIDWLSGPDCLRYTATDKVTVEPFGIALPEGAILEVTWQAGETGYSLAVR